MLKSILIYSLILIPILSFSQDVDRVIVQGTIVAPEGEDLEGLSIYNITSQLGTITDVEGAFTIRVAENDRILITALQFQQFTVIVDRGIIDSKSMHVALNPAVNQLGEVIVSPYDLSGNIVADVKRIKVTEINVNYDTTYEDLEFGYEFSADQWSSIVGNRAELAYHNGQTQNGGDILGLIGLFVKPKKSTKKQSVIDRQVAITAIRQRFSNVYIHETFGIPMENVNDFIYFIEETSFDVNLLKAENEIELLAEISRKSKIYNRQLREN